MLRTGNGDAPSHRRASHLRANSTGHLVTSKTPTTPPSDSVELEATERKYTNAANKQHARRRRFESAVYGPQGGSRTGALEAEVLPWRQLGCLRRHLDGLGPRTQSPGFRRRREVYLLGKLDGIVSCEACDEL